jgi:transcriptional antiterminator RfaH
MISTASSCRWYVVQSKPKQELRADANLRQWGLDTLTPLIREPCLSPASDQRFHRVSALFPGYLFAQFPLTLLAKVRLTRGVRDVVGFGEYATPVDDVVIELMRSRIDNDGFVRMAEPQPGDSVRITHGPLRSLVGIFETELQGRDRVLILLTALGAQSRVQLAKAHIQKAVRTIA